LRKGKKLYNKKYHDFIEKNIDDTSYIIKNMLQKDLCMNTCFLKLKLIFTKIYCSGYVLIFVDNYIKIMKKL